MTAMASPTAQHLLDTLHSRIINARTKTPGWLPTKGQVRAGKSILVDGKKRVFIQCGRKWGKTEFVIYLLVRWAILHAGSTCAYFGPNRKIAKNIIWKRLKSFIPKEFLLDQSVEKAFKDAELTVRFWNGSEIKIDGTTDEDSGRGVEPHLVVYDEYKDIKDGFREGMEANLEVYQAVELFIGTPPDHENHFTAMAEEIRNDPTGFFIEAPSSEGPVYGTPDGLLKLKKLYDKYNRIGDLATYYREYEGKFVLGGAGALFPMWASKKEKLVQPNIEIHAEIHRNLSKLEWYMISDPGTTTCHATLLAALNPYTKKLYILDEIYEKNAEQTSTRRIWPRIEGLMLSWHPTLPISDDKWYKGYDEAAAWFANEVNDNFGNIGLTPTNKKLTDKLNGLSLIKDQMIEERLVINDKCVWLIWEIERYVKDKNGNIPKKDDHLIDILRYINSAAGFQFKAHEDANDPIDDRGWRAARPSDDIAFEEAIDGMDEDFV